MSTNGTVKTYFVTIPAHKFLHIRNYESIGYWDFWQKQSKIPGQDCETICGLLDSIKGKLDDVGGTEENASSGQLMAYINEPSGRICSWGSRLRRHTEFDFRRTTAVKSPQICSLWTFLRGSISFSSMGPLTTPPKTAPSKQKSSRL